MEINKHKENLLTSERLKELLHYDPSTGLFIRKTKVTGSVNIGDIAGHGVHGYIVIEINSMPYRAHRLAWLYVYDVWPKEYIDHVNHIRDDNRITNLREVTRTLNQRNRTKRKDNKSGMTGVYPYGVSGKWGVNIGDDGKQVYLGCFFDKFEAICCRKSAENKYGYHENHGRAQNEAI